jgi:hypothetical protein
MKTDIRYIGILFYNALWPKYELKRRWFRLFPKDGRSVKPSFEIIEPIQTTL